MSEEQRGGPIEFSREPERLPVLRDIEERLSQVESPEQALEWVQVWEQLQQQDNFIREREFMRQLALERHRDMLKETEHRRFLEKVASLGKVGLSVAVIGIGIGFVFGGFGPIGFFTLGAGLFWLAPEVVRAFLPRGPRRGREDSDND